MGIFKIKKLSDDSFWHDFNGKSVNISDFEVILDENTDTFIIQLKNGATVPNTPVDIADVIVNVNGGSDEPFTSAIELRQRLEEIDYTPYKSAGGGGGTQDYDSVLAEGNETDETATHTDGENYASISPQAVIVGYTGTEADETENVLDRQGVTFKKYTAPNAFEKLLAPNADGSKLQYDGDDLATEQAVVDAITPLADDINALTTALDGKQDELGFTPENTANKATTMTGNTASNTVFLTAKAVYDWVIGLGYTTLSAVQTWVNNQGFITNVITALGYTPENSANKGQANGYAPLNGSTKIADAYIDDKYNSIIAETVTDGAVTSGTSNTYSIGILIPANTVKAGTSPEVFSLAGKTGTAGIITTRMYINTTNDLSGTPILIALSPGAAASTRTIPLHRYLRVVTADGSGLGTLITNNTVSMYSDYVISTSPLQSLAIDWTVDQYLIISCQCGSGSDSARSKHLKFRR